MSLILATGSNLGDSQLNLNQAKLRLCKEFKFISESRLYTSKAVDYLDQPDFWNQVLEFELPETSPKECMSLILDIEKELGRRRDIPKGPRVIDIDILYFGLNKSEDPHILLPHPRIFERSFVVLPLKELPYFNILQKHYDFPSKFDNEAFAKD
jgi:2-amino-4-hydroxy-6-hydroxymethyldihydropteridine diphosphokinase